MTGSEHDLGDLFPKPDEETEAAIGLPFSCYCLLEQIKELALDLSATVPSSYCVVYYGSG